MVQVVTFVTGTSSSASKWLEYETYAQMGWKGVLFAVVVGAVLFGVIKHHIGFRNIGPNEAGIREIFGFKLWKLGPGPHFYITGFTNVRKAPLAVSQIDLVGEAKLLKIVWRYDVSVLLRVIDSRKALIARIYFVEDSDKADMENAENIKQVTTLLKRSVRRLVEAGNTPDDIEAKLKTTKKVRLERDYGSRVLDVLVTELVPRPHSELAEAIRDSGPNAAILGAVLADEEISRTGHPHLEALDGGGGAS